MNSGKVRELYDAGDGRLLMVASDRMSAFDVVLDEPIPDKGRVLTAMTVHWLEELADLAPSHLVSADPAAFPAEAADIGAGLEWLAGRALLVRRADMLPLECIVRGYLAGSGWKEYARARARCTARRCRPAWRRRPGSPSPCSRPPPRPVRVTT